MFEYLKKFKKIIVTGPNRSGTRICARMISYDLGYPYVDEEDIHIDSVFAFSRFLFSKIPLVIQCPSLSRYIHYFNSTGRAIIFMKRGKTDISSSQKRIKWSWEWLERLRYDKTEGKISEIKYMYLNSVQKKKIKNLYEIEYETLSDHPMWIYKEKRNLFNPDQYLPADNNNREIRKLYPFRAPGVSSHFFENKTSAILMNSKRDLKQINSTGIRIWNLCNGKSMSEDITKKIKNDFQNVEKNKIEEDTIKFIIELSKKGFIQLLRFPIF